MNGPRLSYLKHIKHTKVYLFNLLPFYNKEDTLSCPINCVYIGLFMAGIGRFFLCILNLVLQ